MKAIDFYEQTPRQSSGAILVADSYFTESRRENPAALPYEPYHDHKIHEGATHTGGFAWRIEEHPDAGWFGSPSAARAAIDRCVEKEHFEGCPVMAMFTGDPFDRFDR